MLILEITPYNLWSNGAGFDRNQFSILTEQSDELLSDCTLKWIVFSRQDRMGISCDYFRAGTPSRQYRGTEQPAPPLRSL